MAVTDNEFVYRHILGKLECALYQLSSGRCLDAPTADGVISVIPMTVHFMRMSDRPTSRPWAVRALRFDGTPVVMQRYTRLINCRDYIQEHFGRRAIASLNSAITDALERVSKEHGEFSYVELWFALSETMNRWAGHALREEWKE